MGAGESFLKNRVAACGLQFGKLVAEFLSVGRNVGIAVDHGGVVGCVRVRRVIPASPVNNADDGNKIVVGHVAVNHDIRRNKANADEAAKLGAPRAAFGERRQAQIERVKVRAVAVGNKLARLRGKIAENEQCPRPPTR